MAQKKDRGGKKQLWAWVSNKTYQRLAEMAYAERLNVSLLVEALLEDAMRRNPKVIVRVESGTR